MKLYDRLKTYSHQNNSVLPTPLHKLGRLSKLLKRSIYCKRDDLTGFGFGGNKSRKLDYLVVEALKQKADTLIAVGGVQSNFCRMVAATGKVNNLQVHLVLGGKKPAKKTGNLLLDELLGANCHYINSKDWNVWEKESQALEKRLIKNGRRVFRMPIGGATVTGCLAYVRAFSEILDDAKRMKTSFDVIVLACGSGGTQAGLITGKKLFNWPGRIIGISVAKNKKQQQEDVFELASKTAGLFNCKIKNDDVIADDNYIGKGYAIRTPGCRKALELFINSEGVFLDYVYTAKAAAGLIDYIKKGIIRKKENILFLHTGGNVEIFE